MENIKWYFLLALVDACYTGEYLAKWRTTKETEYLLMAIVFFFLGLGFNFKIFQLLG